MELNVKDRLMFNSLFPQQGDLIAQTLIRDITKKVALTQDEIKEVELKVTANGFNWNNEKAVPKDVTFTEAELEFIKQQVERLDREKKITQDNLDLCMKIKNTETD